MDELRVQDGIGVDAYRPSSDGMHRGVPACFREEQLARSDIPRIPHVHHKAVYGPKCEQGKIARGRARETDALGLVGKRGKCLQLLSADLTVVVPAKFTKVDHGLLKGSRRGNLDRLPVAKSSPTANSREHPFPGRKRDDACLDLLIEDERNSYGELRALVEVVMASVYGVNDPIIAGAVTLIFGLFRQKPWLGETRLKRLQNQALRLQVSV